MALYASPNAKDYKQASRAWVSEGGEWIELVTYGNICYEGGFGGFLPDDLAAAPLYCNFMAEPSHIGYWFSDGTNKVPRYYLPRVDVAGQPGYALRWANSGSGSERTMKMRTGGMAENYGGRRVQAEVALRAWRAGGSDLHGTAETLPVVIEVYQVGAGGYKSFTMVDLEWAHLDDADAQPNHPGRVVTCGSFEWSASAGTQIEMRVRSDNLVGISSSYSFWFEVLASRLKFADTGETVPDAGLD